MCFSMCESETETNAMNFHRIFPFWFAEVPYDKITDCDVQETHSIFYFFSDCRYPKSGNSQALSFAFICHISIHFGCLQNSRMSQVIAGNHS